MISIEPASARDFEEYDRLDSQANDTQAEYQADNTNPDKFQTWQNAVNEFEEFKEDNNFNMQDMGS